MMKHRHVIGQIVFFLSLSLNSHASYSQEAQSIHLGKETNVQQVIDILSPKEAGARPKTRGLSLHSQNTDEIRKPRALSLEIYFEFDSYELVNSAKDQLRPVGEALKSEQLESVSFTLEGHTDNVGEAHYNQNLSEKRAKAVKAFLESEFDVPSDKVQAVGAGESRLFDQENPESGVNRRVTIIAN